MQVYSLDSVTPAYTQSALKDQQIKITNTDGTKFHMIFLKVYKNYDFNYLVYSVMWY